MQYIFDFDRTLFDTDRFKSEASLVLADPAFVSGDMWKTFDAASYLYNDVLDFLRGVEKARVIILSAISPQLGPQAFDFQMQKIEASGIDIYVDAVICMEGDKGPHVETLCKEDDTTVFVDDLESQLISVRNHCKDVQLFQILRPGSSAKHNTEGISIISQLAELKQTIQ